jgi:thymidylate synthase (FAD)
MRLIKPSYVIEGIYGNNNYIEKIGRVCYKSEDKITNDSSDKFVKKIIDSGHESVLEHSLISVRFIVDRGFSLELVRHRLCAFSQESTRYCNYKSGVVFIIPPWIDFESGEYKIVEYDLSISQLKKPTELIWYESMLQCEKNYLELLDRGWKPQQARSVLPNSLKTEIVCTANFREWRHIFSLRTSQKAHPQMREIMIPLLKDVQLQIPVIFDDIKVNKSKESF